MKGIFGIFSKDERAFTGLESAIVLTAFVVVAAVFSYVVLGAGFTTSDTAKATIDEGVKQASSSVQLAGDVIAEENETATDTVGEIIVTLQLTAGQAPVDIGDSSTDRLLVVSYWDDTHYCNEATWDQDFIGENDGDTVLEQHEKVELTITVPADASLANATTAANQEFKIEVKPKVGAVLPISRTTPPEIDPVMNLK